MEFVTIHDLSRELNVPARVVRYRLIQLIAEGKLKEGDDFRRHDFKDDQHFVWKIHPLRFVEQSRLKPVVTTALTIDNKVGNDSLPAVNQGGNTHGTNGTESAKAVTQTDNNVDNNIANNNALKAGETGMAREMIDLLKEQIRIKDGQLREQGEQMKESHELTMKLTGTVLQQAQKIEDMLRLPSSKNEVTDAVTTEGNVVNQPETPPIVSTT